MLKQCFACKQWKDVSEFAKNMVLADGLFPSCKACMVKIRKDVRINQAEIARQWHEEHKEEIEADKLARRQKSAEIQRIATARWRSANSEKCRETSRLWRKENPERQYVSCVRYRVRKRTAEGTDYTQSEHINARREMWGGRCYLCGELADSIDHVIPLSKGGTHWPANLRPICRRCNSVKSDQWPYDITPHKEQKEGYDANH